MKRLARYFWSLSVGIVGFFIGMIYLGSYHAYDDWQVGLAGFLLSLALVIPTYFVIDRVTAPLGRIGVVILTLAGGVFFVAAMGLYVMATFH